MKKAWVRVVGLLAVMVGCVVTMALVSERANKMETREMIGYKVVGTGSEKVIVMHSWFGNIRSYDAMLPYLDGKKYTYAFVDLRGYGSSKELEGTYTLQEAANDVMEVVDALGWKQFHVVGHSMSGMIAQKIALDHFARVKSVVAITPVPACGSPAPAETMAFLDDAARTNDGNAIGCVQMVTGYRHTDDFVKALVDSWRQYSVVKARVAYLDMFSNTDFSADVKGLKTPMLVLYGEHDMEDFESFLRNTFLQWYPNARMECCRDAGHFPMQETPAALAASLEAFLGSQTSK